MLEMETNYPTLLYGNAFSEGEFPKEHGNQFKTRLRESTCLVLGSTKSIYVCVGFLNTACQKKDKCQNQEINYYLSAFLNLPC